MDAALILLLQAATATAPERIDLTLPAAAAAGCREPVGDDIIVCGGRADRYRLRPLEPRSEGRAIPAAETGLFGGGAEAAVETEAVQMPGGLQSNRLMVRIKLPF